MVRTIGQCSEDALILMAYLESTPPGVKLPYAQIEQDTGIEMNYNGKQMLYRALRRKKIDYDTVRGEAIIVVSADNGLKIVGKKTHKVVGAVDRATETTNRIAERFIEDMPPEKQKVLKLIQGAFGAIEIAKQQVKAIYKVEIKNIQNAKKHIPLPEK